MKAEITVNARGYGSLTLDGHDVSNGVRGFTLTSGVHGITRLDLDVLLLDVSRVSAADPEIHIPDASHDLLVWLGWTPPTDSTSPSEPAPPADSGDRPAALQ